MGISGSPHRRPALSGLTPTTNIYNSANQMGATDYDAAGNQTQFGANTLVYDAENHVVQANEAPSSAAARRSMFTMATAAA